MTPNCSLSPRGARWFFGSVCAGMLAIVLPLTLMGYWPVLPFAGLELGLHRDGDVPRIAHQPQRHHGHRGHDRHRVPRTAKIRSRHVPATLGTS